MTKEETISVELSRVDIETINEIMGSDLDCWEDDIKNGEDEDGSIEELLNYMKEQISLLKVGKNIIEERFRYEVEDRGEDMLESYKESLKEDISNGYFDCVEECGKLLCGMEKVLEKLLKEKVNQ